MKRRDVEMSGHVEASLGMELNEIKQLAQSHQSKKRVPKDSERGIEQKASKLLKNLKAKGITHTLVEEAHQNGMITKVEQEIMDYILSGHSAKQAYETLAHGYSQLSDFYSIIEAVVQKIKEKHPDQVRELAHSEKPKFNELSLTAGREILHEYFKAEDKVFTPNPSFSKFHGQAAKLQIRLTEIKKVYENSDHHPLPFAALLLALDGNNWIQIAEKLKLGVNKKQSGNIANMCNRILTKILKYRLNIQPNHL